MKPMLPAALAATMALAACNSAPTTTDNAMVNADDAAALDNAAFDEAPVVENVADADTAAVEIAAVPRPAAGTPPAEAEPLADAAVIEDEIRAGNGVQRIRYGEGWAWMRGGRILRTADRDGRNISYFRPGDDKPFFVQRGDHGFAYRDGRPVREFDRDGRPRAPDADRTREADEAAAHARDQRDRAERAREYARPGRDRHDGRPDATPTPSPSPSASPTGRGPWRRGDRDRPTPTPQDNDRDGRHRAP